MGKAAGEGTKSGGGRGEGFGNRGKARKNGRQGRRRRGSRLGGRATVLGDRLGVAFNPSI